MLLLLTSLVVKVSGQPRELPRKYLLRTKSYSDGGGVYHSELLKFGRNCEENCTPPCTPCMVYKGVGEAFVGQDKKITKRREHRIEANKTFYSEPETDWYKLTPVVSTVILPDNENESCENFLSHCKQVQLQEYTFGVFGRVNFCDGLYTGLLIRNLGIPTGGN